LTSLPSPWIRGEESVTTAEEEEEHPGEQPRDDRRAAPTPHDLLMLRRRRRWMRAAATHPDGGCELLRSLPGFGASSARRLPSPPPPPDPASSGLRRRRHPTMAAPRLLLGARGRQRPWLDVVGEWAAAGVPTTVVFSLFSSGRAVCAWGRGNCWS
jgi:hypothetical protein